MQDGPSGWACNSLVSKGHRPRSRKVACLQFDEGEASWTDEAVDLAVEVTTSSNPLPYWRQPMLPFLNFGVGGEAVLNEQEPPIGLQHSLDFGECSLRMLDAAECPGQYHGVEAPVVKHELLCGSTE